MRSFSVSAAAVAALSLAGAAFAQEIKVGAPIVGKAGEPVGTVASVDADTVTVAAPDGSTFGLPAAGFKADGDTVTAAWTRAEIDQAVAQQRAAAGVKADASNVTAGQAVRGKDGAEVGTVASTVVEGGALKTVMIKGADGTEFGLPAGALTLEGGALVAAWTKAEIDQARGAAAAPGTASSGTASSGR
jgi:hypothetical protein